MSKNIKKEFISAPRIAPSVQKGLIALFIVTIGILIILAFLGLAGSLGDRADMLLIKGTGLLRYVLPFILFFIAYQSDTKKDDGEETNNAYRMTHYIGAFLLILALAGLLHLSLGDSRSGMGGGYLGFYLTLYPLRSLGLIGTAVIFGSLFIASLLFMFNSSLFSLLKIPQSAGSSLFSKMIHPFQRKKEFDDDDVGIEDEIDDEEKPTFMRRLLNMAGGTSSDDEEEDFSDDENEDKEIIDEEDVDADDDEIMIEKDISPEELEADENDEDEIPLGLPAPKKIPIRPYQFPPLSLLKRSVSSAKPGDIKNNEHIIKKTYANFGIDVEMGDVCVGPTVAQYTLRPADGIKLNRITALCNDLSLALAAHPIRIEAPIPGKSLVGIEVPNQKTATVTLLDLLDNDEFTPIKSLYHIALGKDVSGKPIYAHLPSMPHMLVAGATGSGKTVCINTIILSLIFQHSPQELRFIMVDPKRVELPLYNGIPHLLTPVITDVQKTINALKWSIGEMERRFDLLAKSKKRDIISYNSAMLKRNEEQLPLIVFVIDELADLMVAAGNEVEGGIIRLAQMARAVGIHLILATQRPSVDVITGLLKANIPGRIAFSVASLIDSRTILDSAGAEKLVGRGDMLFQNAQLSSPKRIQGAFVSEEEMKRVLDFIKHDDAPVYDDAVTERQRSTTIFSNDPQNNDDPLFEEARGLVVAAGKASASYLQRRLKIGYARAARLLDILEEAGIIGPSQGAKPREILIAKKSNDIIDDDEDAEEINDDEFDDTDEINDDEEDDFSQLR